MGKKENYFQIIKELCCGECKKKLGVLNYYCSAYERQILNTRGPQW